MSQLKMNIIRFKELVIDATAALRDDEYDKAIAIYKKALQADDKEIYAVAVKSIAQCYGWKGDLESAIKYADELLTLDPNDSEILLLTASYWYSKQNEEMTYKYVCRYVENPPEPIEQIPKWIFWIIKPFSLFFKNLRNLEKRSKFLFAEHNCRDIGKVAWAKKYKKQYESKQEFDKNQDITIG
jgi:tetratricopeptide (TPR) repeat protein